MRSAACYKLAMDDATYQHPSSSTEQSHAEGAIRALLSEQLKVSFSDPPDCLGKLRLDAYADDRLPVLVEIFAHVGPCKAGQRRKLSRDMTKLLLAERLLGRRCRMLIAVVDEQVIPRAASSWDGDFASRFGIEFVRVAVADELRAMITRAQRRQVMTNA